MGNPYLASTRNMYNMLNITSKLQMSLKMSSPYYLLVTTDIQQIQNDLTAILTKLTSDNPTENTWTKIRPIDATGTMFRQEVRVYATSNTLCQFAQMFSESETRVWCVSFTWRIYEQLLVGMCWISNTKSKILIFQDYKIKVHLHNTHNLPKYAWTTNYKNYFNGKIRFLQ